MKILSHKEKRLFEKRSSFIKIADLQVKEKELYLQAAEALGLIKGIEYVGQDWLGLNKQEK